MDTEKDLHARTFSIDLQGPGADRLRQTVKARLSDIMGSYTDDVLAEYVVVLVGHNKQHSQAAADLEAFLGEKTGGFVDWLWEHLAANKHLYAADSQPGAEELPPAGPPENGLTADGRRADASQPQVAGEESALAQHDSGKQRRSSEDDTRAAEEEAQRAYTDTRTEREDQAGFAAHREEGRRQRDSRDPRAAHDRRGGGSDNRSRDFQPEDRSFRAGAGSDPRRRGEAEGGHARRGRGREPGPVSWGGDREPFHADRERDGPHSQAADQRKDGYNRSRLRESTMRSEHAADREPGAGRRREARGEYRADGEREGRPLPSARLAERGEQLHRGWPARGEREGHGSGKPSADGRARGAAVRDEDAVHDGRRELARADAAPASVGEEAGRRLFRQALLREEGTTNTTQFRGERESQLAAAGEERRFDPIVWEGRHGQPRQADPKRQRSPQPTAMEVGDHAPRHGGLQLRAPVRLLQSAMRDVVPPLGSAGALRGEPLHKRLRSAVAMEIEEVLEHDDGAGRAYDGGGGNGTLQDEGLPLAAVERELPPLEAQGRAPGGVWGRLSGATTAVKPNRVDRGRRKQHLPKGGLAGKAAARLQAAPENGRFVGTPGDEGSNGWLNGAAATEGLPDSSAQEEALWAVGPQGREGAAGRQGHGRSRRRRVKDRLGKGRQPAGPDEWPLPQSQLYYQQQAGYAPQGDVYPPDRTHLYSLHGATDGYGLESEVYGQWHDSGGAFRGEGGGHRPRAFEKIGADNEEFIVHDDGAAWESEGQDHDADEGGGPPAAAEAPPEDGEPGLREDDAADIHPHVAEMKKKLRSIQLEMTKLRARQAEVSKRAQAPETVLPRVGDTEKLGARPSKGEVNARSVVVQNVHFAATVPALASHFESCGEIVRVTILTDAATGQPRGYAYIEFSSEDAVQRAIALSGVAFLSRPLKVTPKASTPVPPRPPAFASAVRPPIRRPSGAWSPFAQGYASFPPARGPSPGTKLTWVRPASEPAAPTAQSGAKALLAATPAGAQGSSSVAAGSGSAAAAVSSGFVPTLGNSPFPQTAQPWTKSKKALAGPRSLSYVRKAGDKGPVPERTGDEAKGVESGGDQAADMEM